MPRRAESSVGLTGRPLVLDVVATAGHLHERLVRATAQPGHRARSSAVAPGTVDWQGFVARALSALCPDVVVASTEIERVTLAAAVRAVLPAYDAAFTERAGTVDSFARTLDVLRRHEVTPAALGDACACTEDGDHGTRHRLRMLAEVLADHDRRLASAGVVARACVESRVADAAQRCLDEGVAPTSRGAPASLRLWHVAELAPARVRMILSWSRWLRAHGGRVELHVAVEPRRVKLPLTLDRALRAFEADEHGGLDVQYNLRDPSAPDADPQLTAWITALAEGGRSHEAARASRVEAPIALAEAHGPDEEARWVAARIESWIARGWSPDEVAVVLRKAVPELVATLGRALDDARIPWSAPRGQPLLSSPLARSLLGLARTVARGAEREDVLRVMAVLQGNAARAGEPAPWRVAAAMRAMGIETLFDTELAARFRRARAKGVSAAVIAAIDALARDLWALSLDGTAREHAERLSRWIDRAGSDGRFLEESRTVIATAGFDAGAQVILRALARDEAGLAAASELLREMPSIAEAAGRDGVISAGEFGEMLLDVARTRALSEVTQSGGVSSGGVQILEVDEARCRSFRAMVLPGLHEGGFPMHREDEALWGDPERLAVGRSLKAPIERTATRESEVLLLLGALATSTDEVAASTARHDAGGHVHTVSPFFGDMQRTAGVVVERVGSDPLARSRRVPPRGTERTLRRWAREGAPEMLPASMQAVVQSVEVRQQVERRRQEFFATPHAPGDRYNGRIDHDLALVKDLGLARWAGVSRPLDVTILERAARCGFKAFAYEVLKIEERPDEMETLDDKQRGHLLHKLLEVGQEALQATRGEDASLRWQAVREALDEAGAEFSLKEASVDAGLLEADLRAIRRQVEVWLSGRMHHPDGWEMIESEVAFGPNRKWPALEVRVDDGESVVVRGRIDGVERVGLSLRVLEFKSGRGDGYRKRLQEGVLDTSFQLVLYAAALERARRAGAVSGDAGSVDGLYVGFRDLTEHGLREALSRPRKKSAPIDVGDVIDRGSEGDGPLADAVRRVVGPLRKGHFEPRPRDCVFCQYRSLCRVEAHEESDDDVDPVG